MSNSRQLEQFINEGRALLVRLREIEKEVETELWWPRVEEISLADFFDRGWQVLNKNDPSESIRFKRNLEREREEKVLDSIKNWESRAAACVDSFAGAEARNKLINGTPSIEAGFSRAPKTPSSQSEQTYWTLSDAVSSRVDALLQIDGKGSGEGKAE